MQSILSFHDSLFLIYWRSIFTQYIVKEPTRYLLKSVYWFFFKKAGILYVIVKIVKKCQLLGMPNTKLKIINLW